MPLTSTTPGGVSIPPGYSFQRLTLSSPEIGEIISGEFPTASIPGFPLSHTISSTNVITATAGLKSAIDAKIASPFSSAWSDVTITDGTTYLDVFWLTVDGALNFSSNVSGGGSMVTRIWTANSVERAQVTQVTPLNVLTGDIFTLKVGEKPISVTATDSTASNVVALFVAAINATQIPEWREVEASASGDTLIVTSRVAGRPFTLTSGSSDAVGLEITTTTAGASGTNASQSFAIPKSAGGTFELTFGDQTVVGMAIGASATTVRSAFESLSTVGAGNVAVTKADSSDGNDDVYTITFQGTLAKTPVAEVIVDLISTKPLIRTIQQGAVSGTVRNEKQTIEFGSGGTFTLTLDGQTTTTITGGGYTFDDSAQIRAAFNDLSNVRSCTVTKLSQDARFGTALYQIEFDDYDGTASQSQITASTYSTSATQSHRMPITVTAGIVSVNEVQKVAIQGTATGGTFTLTYSGQTTNAIAWNASTSAVTSALEALSNVGVGDVAVTGSAGAWIVTFQGALAGGDRPQMTATSSLTGSAAANVTIVTTVTSAGPNHWDSPENWLPVGVPQTGDHVRFEIGSTDCLYGLEQTGVTLASMWVMQTYGGSIGLPRVNENGYLEYRPRSLQLGVTEAQIGLGEEGNGPRKVAIDTGTVATAITVWNSGDSSEQNVPTVIWKGDNVANVIVVENGDFGCSWWSDESSRFSKLTQRGGTVFLRYATIVDELNSRNQALQAFECTLGGKRLNV